MLVPLERCSLTFLAFFNFTNIGNYIILIIAVVLLIVMAYFLSLSETAYTTVNIVKLRNYMEAKRKGAKKAVYIAEKFDLTLTSLMISRYIVNIAAVAITTYIFSNIITGNVFSLIISGVIMLIFFVIFGDIIPKAYAKEHAEQTALNISGLLYIIIKIQFPITWIFMKLKKILIKKDTSYESYVTEDELESIIDVMEYEGVIEKDNAELLQSAMNLSEITVYDIMTPRVDIVAVDVNDEIEDIKNIFFENKFSRIPVYDDDIDNILGVLTERDFLTAYVNLGPDKMDIRELMIKPNFISKQNKVDELIKEMQELKIHLAIVSDEYGGTSGIVTMEDALEELVGEIYDETDEYDETEDPEKIISVSENKYRISAEMEINYLFDELNIDNYPDTKYSSIGGFVYKLFEDISSEGQKVEYLTSSLDGQTQFKLIFTIEKMSSRRIKVLTVEVFIIDEEQEVTE